MNRKTRKTRKTTAGSAAHALHILIADGKLTAKHVTDALKRRGAMIRGLRERLAELEKDGPFPFTKSAYRTVANPTKRRVSAARRSAMQLHGKYLGSIRRLPKAARAEIKAVRVKKGIRAAIAAAKRLDKA